MGGLFDFLRSWTGADLFHTLFKDRRRLIPLNPGWQLARCKTRWCLVFDNTWLLRIGSNSSSLLQIGGNFGPCPSSVGSVPRIFAPSPLVAFTKCSTFLPCLFLLRSLVVNLTHR